MHHHGRFRIPIPRHRVDEADAIGDAGRTEAVDEGAPAVLHGLGFQPRGMQFWRDDQNPKRRHAQHLLRQFARDPGGAGELVLDVHEARRGPDRCDQRAFDLPERRTCRTNHLGPGDTHRQYAQPDRHIRRPAQAFQRAPIINLLACRAPAFLHEVEQPRRRIPVDHALNIMKRQVWLALGITARCVIGAMITRVPAPDRQIEPADERQ